MGDEGVWGGRDGVREEEHADRLKAAEKIRLRSGAGSEEAAADDWPLRRGPCAITPQHGTQTSRRRRHQRAPLTAGRR